VADDELPSGVVLLDRPRRRRSRPGPSDPAPGRPAEGPGDPARPGTSGPTTDTTGATDAAPAAPHPRIRRRRLAVQRDRGRRRLHRVTWVLAVVATVVTGAALAQTPLLDVDRVQVAGADRTAVATVRWAAGIARGDALLTLDEAGAEQRVEELPWVAEADVVRDWPGTVRVAVTERTPAALVQLGTGLPPAVVDAHGRVLDVGGPVPPGLVTVTRGPGRLTEGATVPATVRDALRVAVGAAERAPGAVVSVSPDLEATLAGGGVVRFGSAEALEEKLVALATVLSDVDLTDLAVLDLRVPSSPALTRQP
jgi:cell division protein FtsQ